MIEIVEIRQKLEENATQIMIFLPHYMWAKNYKVIHLVIYKYSAVQDHDFPPPLYVGEKL